MSTGSDRELGALGTPMTEPGLEHFLKQQKLGEGTYGIVFKAFDTRTKKFVALKKIRMDNEEQGVPPTTLREVATLLELKHPNIVQLLDVVNVGTNLYLVFEFMVQDLRRYMDNAGGMGSEGPMLIKSYMYQLLNGLAYCHSHRILHRDLKPQNLLIDAKGYLKLADFGLARVFSIPLRPYSHEVVTLWYRAPEVLLGDQRYSTPIDIWSAGAIFAEMLSHQPLFPGDSEIDELYRIFRIMGTPTEDVWPGVKNLPYWKDIFPHWTKQEWRTTFPTITDPNILDLLDKMLVYDPAQRISAKAALEHPYFAELDKSPFQPTS